MLGIQAGIVGGQIRVASIAENAFDEIQIGHQAPRRKKPDFHGFLANITRYLWANDRPDQQRNE